MSSEGPIKIEDLKKARKLALAGKTKDALKIYDNMKYENFELKMIEKEICVTKLLANLISAQSVNSQEAYQRKEINTRRIRKMHHPVKQISSSKSLWTSLPDVNDRQEGFSVSSLIVPNEKIKTSFQDVIGLDSAKQAIEEIIMFPKLLPDYFKSANLSAQTGILLFGPPGTGKTLLASAICKEFDLLFASVSASNLCQKLRGESEKTIALLFDYCRVNGPAIIFFDEIDSIFNKRHGDGEHEASRRMKSELLIQIDGISSLTLREESTNVIILAATNYPWSLDDAVSFLYVFMMI